MRGKGDMDSRAIHIKSQPTLNPQFYCESLRHFYLFVCLASLRVL